MTYQNILKVDIFVIIIRFYHNNDDLLVPLQHEDEHSCSLTSEHAFIYCFIK